VIGASAGGVDALITIIPKIPSGFPAAVFIVVHIPPEVPSLLARILGRHSRLRVQEAADGVRWKSGVIYVAAPDCHLVLNDGVMRSARGPRENRHRPAIDPLFRSAALHFGPRAIGVVLTGTLDDGTAGAVAVKAQGGRVVVQDPADAMFPSMPASVMEHVKVDAVVTIETLVPTLIDMLNAPVAGAVAKPGRDLELEVRMATLESDALEEQERPGKPSPYSCPDCGGVLWEIDDAGNLTRFRCRVGHSFSPDTMIAAQGDQLEEALWSAVKTLEETVRLSRRIAEAERRRGHEWMVARFEEKEREAAARAETIRRVLVRVDTVPVESSEEQQQEM
jgi:two-component system chemotaxis response regulator CheB